jgi:flagellar FliJ protein
MKKFVYSLQRILTLRERREELLRQEMSRLVFKRNQHDHVKFYFEKKLNEDYEKQRTQTSFTPNDRIQQDNHMSETRGQIYHQKLLISEYEAKIENKRLEILENRKAIRTLERLKERKWDQYQYETLIDERKTMDEIANRSVVVGL